MSKRTKSSRHSSSKLKRARFGGAPTVVTTTTRRTKSKTSASNALMKQVRALVKAKHRDAADVSRQFTFSPGNEFVSACLMSTTDFSTAPSTTGLLDTDADEVMVNHVRIKGEFGQPMKSIANPDEDYGTRVRQLVVWFNKPLLVASAAGTLPPPSEVLVDVSVDGLPVQNASNGGRFKILSDRQWNLGRNGFYFEAAIPGASTGVFAPIIEGRSRVPFDYTVKVGRTCKFVAPSSSGPGAGGHYDSDQPAGQVSSGLLVMYTIQSSTAPLYVELVSKTRLNYTG